MKKKYSFLYMLALLAFSSCVEDEGCNDMHPINEAKIEGIESQYYKVADIEDLNVPVQLTGSLSGDDASAFDCEWFLCKSTIGQDKHEHTTISREKDLNYSLKGVKPGDYTLYFIAMDKESKLKTQASTNLRVLSPYVRGFYLFGDKEDGTCGIDFVGMIEEKDTAVITDMFNNTAKIKGAENLIFLGDRSIRTDLEGLWAITKDGSYQLSYTATDSKINVNDHSMDDVIWNTITTIHKPFKVLDIQPHAFGPSNMMTSGTWRCVMTDQATFFGTLYQGENYGNPINCYTSGSSELTELSPYVFYKANSSYVSAIAFYDKTKHKFVRQNAAYYSMTNLADYTETSETPFSLDQTKYSPVRDLVYGENGYGNKGASYALMNDADGNYYVYMFSIASTYANGFTKSLARTIDKTAAVDIDKASHYAFYSQQPILLYAVGNDVWAYNYNTKKAAKIKSFNGEVTYLAMDYDSAGNPDDVIVATYSPTEKGTVYKFEMEDDPNVLGMKEKEYATPNYPWKTNLKVVKVEYRNCPD